VKEVAAGLLVPDIDHYCLLTKSSVCWFAFSPDRPQLKNVGVCYKKDSRVYLRKEYVLFDVEPSSDF